MSKWTPETSNCLQSDILGPVGIQKIATAFLMLGLFVIVASIIVIFEILHYRHINAKIKEIKTMSIPRSFSVQQEMKRPTSTEALVEALVHIVPQINSMKMTTSRPIKVQSLTNVD